LEVDGPASEVFASEAVALVSVISKVVSMEAVGSVVVGLVIARTLIILSQIKVTY